MGLGREVSMTRVRVVLADPHQIVTDGLRQLLAPLWEVVEVVRDGLALLEAVQRLQPDLIVTELGLPGNHGLEVIRHLTHRVPPVKVLVLTTQQDQAAMARALAAGAAGYVVKAASAAELRFAMQEVWQGRLYRDPHLAAGQAPRWAERGAQSAPTPLTVRQWEVLQLLAVGYSAKEVAARLQISPRTAEFHKYRIMELLGVRSTAALIHYAITQGVAL